MLVGNSSRRIGGVVLLVLSLTFSVWVGAAQATPLKVVRYHGYVVKVPRSWKVYDLAKNPHVCVRFDRHAVYLGAPTAQEQCPAHAVGRTEAILLQPANATIRRALARSTASAAAAAAVPRGAGAATFLARSRGIVVTATWSHDRGVVADALNRPSLRASAATATASPHPVVRAARPGLVAVGAPRGGGVRRAWVRRVQRPLPDRDDGLGRFALPRDRDLHRRRELAPAPSPTSPPPGSPTRWPPDGT